MRKHLLFLLLLLNPAAALADEAAEIREGHRTAAIWLTESFNEGVKLGGSVMQNGSEGEFEVYFYGEEFLLKKAFGDLEYYVSIKDGEIWDDTNFSLPYLLEPEDHPADMALNMISSGAYLEDPNWEYFKYVSEDAGGYNFTFSPPGLPEINLVLYSDPEEDHYLQVMSTEIGLSKHDPTSMKYRSYYYYEVDDDGRILISKETGKSVDHNGDTVDFSELIVDDIELLEEHPAELTFDRSRTPPAEVADAIEGPVTIPIDTSKGYFIVPVTFEGSEETFHFLFDTGAAVSLFIPEAAEAAGLVTSLTVTGHGHGGHTDLNVGLCTSGMLGEAGAEELIPLAGFPVTMIDEDNLSLLNLMSNYEIGGIMGISMLHQYVGTFDHMEQTLTMYPPATFNAADYVDEHHVALPLDVEDLIHCQGRINEELEGEVVIDTGLQMELAVLGETIAHAGLKLTKIDEGTMTVLNGVRSFSLVLVPTFELGPITLNNLTASVTDDDRGTQSARGLLGYMGVPLFHGLRITIDLFNQQMYIEDPNEIGLFDSVTTEPSEEEVTASAISVDGAIEQDELETESANDTAENDDPPADQE